MNERQAREATLLQAFESAEAPSPSWSDEDRRWADRVALEAVGSGAPLATFVAERAHHAMHRLLPRERAAARWLERRARLIAWSVAIAAGAVVLGLLADPIGASQRINLLTPPLWGVVLWNLAVYLLLLVAPVVGLGRGRPARPGWLRRAADGLLQIGLRMPSAAPGSAWRRTLRAATGRAADAASSAVAAASPLARFAALWSARSGRLASLRAQTLLHVGAAALAAGLIGGLYLRGLALDYRISWESTFLSPPTVHALLSTALAPASALSGIALPDAAGFAALQARPEAPGAGAPAAPWIHLLAITLALVVIGPRLLLAAGSAGWLRGLGRRFALPLDEPYFQRLARLQRGAAAEIDVQPYAHTPTPQAVLGLQALIAEAFGPKAAVRIAATAAFGAEDSAGRVAPAVDAEALAAARASAAPTASHLLILCDLAATPELETHGRFARRLIEGLAPGALVALVVDQTAFRRRFAGMRERLQQRRAAWSDLAAKIGVRPVFVDLDTAPSKDAVADLLGAFAEPPKAPADPAPVSDE
jgi:hypothetical protein